MRTFYWAKFSSMKFIDFVFAIFLQAQQLMIEAQEMNQSNLGNDIGNMGGGNSGGGGNGGGGNNRKNFNNNQGGNNRNFGGNNQVSDRFILYCSFKSFFYSGKTHKTESLDSRFL